MNSAYCNDCQIFLAIENGLCKKCFQKTTFQEEVSVEIPKDLQNEPDISNNAGSFAEISQGSEYPSDFSPTDSEQITDNSQFTGNYDHEIYEPERAADFHPGDYDYQPDERFHAPHFNQYQTYQDNTFDSPGERPNFSIMKIFVPLAIVFSGLIFFFLYSNSFFILSANQTPDAKNVTFITPEPQKPWFSSWFRNTPTAEEIFDKFEKETFSVGKDLTTERYYLSGKVFFTLPNTNQESTFMKLRKGEQSDSFVEKYNEKIQKGPWNYDATFEMYLKIPKKLVMKMQMQDKDPASKQSKIYAFAGSDGQRHWSLFKTFVNGKKDVKEGNTKAFSSFSSNDKFITMTFLREMYEIIGYDGVVTYAGRKHYLVNATKPTGETETLYFDIETGLVNKVDTKDSEICVVRYDLIDGVKMPVSMLQKFGTDMILFDIVEMQKDYLIDDSIFSISEYR